MVRNKTEEKYFNPGSTKVGLDFVTSPALHNLLMPLRLPGEWYGNSSGEGMHISSINPLVPLSVTPGLTGYDPTADGLLARYERSLDRSRSHRFPLLAELKKVKLNRGTPAVLVAVSLLDYHNRERVDHPPLFEKSGLIPDLHLAFPTLDNAATTEAFEHMRSMFDSGPTVEVKRMINLRPIIEEVKLAPQEFYVTQPSVARISPPEPKY